MLLFYLRAKMTLDTDIRRQIKGDIYLSKNQQTDQMLLKSKNCLAT